MMLYDFLDRTAATLYSTRRQNAGERVSKRWRGRDERHGRAVDCSKLHQRRDNRVVDCVDRYSIFAELVAAARQPIAPKNSIIITDRVPPRSVIDLQIRSLR